MCSFASGLAVPIPVLPIIGPLIFTFPSTLSATSSIIIAVLITGKLYHPWGYIFTYLARNGGENSIFLCPSASTLAGNTAPLFTSVHSVSSILTLIVTFVTHVSFVMIPVLPPPCIITACTIAIESNSI